MTQSTRATLQASADANLADNTTGDISPEDVRTLVKDITDSFIGRSDLGDLATYLGAVATAGGTDATNTNAALSSAVASGAADVDAAVDTDHWGDETGLLLVTPQSLAAALAYKTLTLTSGEVAIDGGAFWNGIVTADDDVDFSSATGLGPFRRSVYVTASGGSRTVTASGVDVTSNISTGVAISTGDTGRFDFYLDGAAQAVCEYMGGTDSLLSGGVSDASEAAKGIVELASTAEINTGTAAALAMCPDQFAGSDFGTAVIEVECFGPASDVTTGDGAAYVTIPACMNGMNLVRAQATVVTAGTTNATTVMVHNLTDAADMLSGAISIASAGVAGTVGTVNTSADDVATDDRLRIDVDSVSTTKPKGLTVVLEFRKP